MLEQAEDFRAESHSLHGLLEDVDPARFAGATQFKSWTINDVLQHLHFWNQMAVLAVDDEAALQATLGGILSGNMSLRAFESAQLDGLTGRDLLRTWRAFVDVTADRFADIDPRRRLKWAGPDMSARSAMSARLMETWAHGQAVYDALGAVRVDTDRIRNIAHLGVTTFAWSFVAKGREPPAVVPYVRLLGPSGATWEWNAPSETDVVAGAATEFCQVVAQTRHVADTGLRVVGEAAREWMAVAQCFAGPPHMPPPPGTRFVRETN